MAYRTQADAIVEALREVGPDGTVHVEGWPEAPLRVGYAICTPPVLGARVLFHPAIPCPRCGRRDEDVDPS